MLFIDKSFLLGFLPATFLGYYAIRRWLGGEASATFLLAASGVFYAWWSVPFLFLLVAQLLFNYAAAQRLKAGRNGGLLALAICANLLLLGYFKYRNFFLENIVAFFDQEYILPALIVPLGISFHTFQQIAFLVSTNGGKADLPRLKNYALFILFFPQLVAGPIVLNHEFEPQVSRTERTAAIDWEMIGTGAVIFLFGLFKKTFLADNIAPYVDTAFNPAISLQPLEAWAAVLAFALQLFFDFSGYSDMAVGLGLMFGIRLPANFRDPLRATSIVDFWSRWHITMTRFFMLYVYTPLSVALLRRSLRRRLGRRPEFLLTAAFPTLVTFLAAGFWHGAGWTFGLCGVTQGIALTINQAWRQARMPRLPVVVAWLLTVGTFCIGQAFFRAQTTAQGWQIVGAMLSPWQIRLPEFMSGAAARLGLPVARYEFLTGATFTLDLAVWMALGLALVFALPNPSADTKLMRPTFRLACYASAMAWLVVTYLGAPRTFIYFQF